VTGQSLLGGVGLPWRARWRRLVLCHLLDLLLGCLPAEQAQVDVVLASKASNPANKLQVG
jgi:hypothetical protein